MDIPDCLRKSAADPPIRDAVGSASARQHAAPENHLGLLQATGYIVKVHSAQSSPRVPTIHKDSKLDSNVVVSRPTPIAAELLEAQHKYELTESEISAVFNKPIYQQVINCAAFQRLKKIHFLGSLDYVIDPKGPKPSKRHTRYQHSLGVARLALQFARDRRLTDAAENLCVISALLHDIGHAPLSHSLESVFKKEFGIGHHLISERIVKGDAPIGIGLSKVLRQWNINPFDILTVMNGKASFLLRELFNYSINIDTIEAIIRSSTYIYQRHLFRPPSEVLSALLTPCDYSAETLDAFWLLKDEVYNKLINNPTGVLADYVCQQYMRSHIESFDEDYYYLTESDLRERHPKLFATLERLSTESVLELLPETDEITFARRRFAVNKAVALETTYSIDSRYTQTRTEETYRPRAR